MTDLLQRGAALPPWIWVAPLLFVAVPVITGRIVGRAAYLRKHWVKLITGPSPAPRGWDNLFASPDLTGWLRLRLRDGTWLGGLWGRSDATGLNSCAAGYPEVQDLLIAEVAEVAESDRDGNLLLDAAGAPILMGFSLLIRWDEVTYAEFFPG